MKKIFDLFRFFKKFAHRELCSCVTFHQLNRILFKWPLYLLQVYRGPNKNKCGYKDKYCEEFAPWGYYNTQPADFKKKKYH